MKPLTIMFEFDATRRDDAPSLQWKPGYFCGRFSGGHFRRVWWLCFAVSWVRMDLHDYNRYIESGSTEWKKA